jgi:hypothetical protein
VDSDKENRFDATKTGYANESVVRNWFITPEK